MFCPLPWTHIGIKNSGLLRMCSHSQSMGVNTVLRNKSDLFVTDISTVDVMNCETLKAVRRDFINGKWPEQCRRCQLDKEAGLNSRNEWETTRQKHLFTEEYAKSITLSDGTITDPFIRDLDIRLGNECNLQCMMCFPGESTKLFESYSRITGLTEFYVDGKKYSATSDAGDLTWSKDFDHVSFTGALLKINKIKFGGGEPLIIKRHYQLLEALIANGIAKNVELEYSINLTVIPKSIFELWDHFKMIKICASIDAYGRANEFIRYPSSWDTIVKNLYILDSTNDNIQVFTSTTIGALSLESFGDLMSFLDKCNFKKINKFEGMPAASHLIYNPDSLSIAILSDFEFDKIVEQQLSKLNTKLQNKLKAINAIRKNMRNAKTPEDLERMRADFRFRCYNMADYSHLSFTQIFKEVSKI